MLEKSLMEVDKIPNKKIIWNEEINHIEEEKEDR